MWYSNKKNLSKTKLGDWQEEEKLQCSFEEVIKDLQQNELHGAKFIQTLIKSNLTKNFDFDTKNNFIDLLNL
jgi:hypothetical protein